VVCGHERTLADLAAKGKSWLAERDELLDGHPCSSDQGAERPSRELAVVGNRQGDHLAFLDEDHVTASLAGELPAVFFKDGASIAPHRAH